MRTAVARDSESHHDESQQRPILGLAPVDDPQTHLTDATQGRQIGSEPYDDATQGRKIGSEPHDDATQARYE